MASTDDQRTNNMVEYLEQLEHETDAALQEAHESIAKARKELDNIEANLLRAAERKDHESVGTIYGVSAQAVFSAFGKVEQTDTLRKMITEGVPNQVTVFGPNLNNQGKGDMHVHRMDCGDCAHYGPGKREGGEPGWTITATSQLDVVFDVYDPDDFNYDPDDEDAVEPYLSSIWFAPCCQLPVNSKS